MRTFFLLFFLLLSFAVSSQELTLTYDEAVKIALQQNVDLRTQQNQMKVVKAERNQSIGEFAPTVSANIDGFRSMGNTFLEQEARTINTTSDNLSAGLSANLNLFSGLSQQNQLKVASANFEAQRYLLNRTSQDVMVIVSNQYLQVLLDTELLRIAEDNQKNQEMLYQQIEAMVEAGNRPKSDLYDQLATVKNNELLVLRSKNTMSNDKSKLAITLQLDPTVDLSLKAPDWDLDAILLANYNLDELYGISLANRPDLKQFQSTETASEKSINVARANFMPGLYAFYNVNTRYNNLSSRGLEEQLTTDNRGSRYGLSMNIPIYSGLRNHTFYIRQKVNYENSKINTENLEKTILNDVRNAYQNYMDVKAAYEVSIAQSEAAEMSLKVQKERYTLGIGSLIELTNANNKYVVAASGFAQAKLNLLFQKVILDYHTGTLQVPQE